MKTSFKICLKLVILVAFLCVTPFFSSIHEILAQDQFLSTFVYQQKTLDGDISLKDHMNVLSSNSNITIDKEEIKSETTTQDEPIIPQIPKSSGKRIYIYNTHQSEGYQGGETVMDAAVILGNQLKEKGYDVVLETNDFGAYGKANGLDYNSGYKISNKFINDALVNYGGFDLIIDLHRDAVPRESTFVTIGDKNYAKMMMVIGGLGKNAYEVTKLSSTITDTINQLQGGMMREMMTREAYYNQEMTTNMVLIELGADKNTFDEVKNSIDFLAEGIFKVMG